MEFAQNINFQFPTQPNALAGTEIFNFATYGSPDTLLVCWCRYTVSLTFEAIFSRLAIWYHLHFTLFTQCSSLCLTLGMPSSLSFIYRRSWRNMSFQLAIPYPLTSFLCYSKHLHVVRDDQLQDDLWCGSYFTRWHMEYAEMWKSN